MTRVQIQKVMREEGSLLYSLTATFILTLISTINEEIDQNSIKIAD